MISTCILSGVYTKQQNSHAHVQYSSTAQRDRTEQDRTKHAMSIKKRGLSRLPFYTIAILRENLTPPPHTHAHAGNCRVIVKKLFREEDTARATSSGAATPGSGGGTRTSTTCTSLRVTAAGGRRSRRPSAVRRERARGCHVLHTLYYPLCSSYIIRMYCSYIIYIHVYTFFFFFVCVLSGFWGRGGRILWLFCEVFHVPSVSCMLYY